MKIVEAIILLLSGLGVFLVGVKLLSENMEKLATKGIKKMFNKISGNRLLGVGIGTVSTAIIASSSATTIMVVGLVNAGVVDLMQATTVIFGANIGTTITSIITSLSALGGNDFDLGMFFSLFSCIGIFMSIFSKKEKVRQIGMFFAGLGCLFVGLRIMKSSMAEFAESEFVIDMLHSFKNPFLLFLFGIIATIIVQSSTVIMGVLIAMTLQGITIGGGGNSIYYIVLGTNIGTCVYTLISSVGANTNAKRAAFIHLLFNFLGSIIFFIVLLCWKNFQSGLWCKIKHPSMQLALFHLAFNSICTLIFLPFTKQIVKISELVIKDKGDKEEDDGHSGFLDKRLLTSPAIAIENTKKEAMRMLDMSMNSLERALGFFIAKDDSECEDVFKYNEGINYASRKLTKYLINVSTCDTSKEDEKIITNLHSANSDITRISDLAENVLKYTRREVREDLVFSPQVKEELNLMFDKLSLMKDGIKRLVLDADDKERKRRIKEIDELEDSVDALRKSLINSHMDRLNTGECRAESNCVFINLVSNLERVGDHLSYITHSLG